MIKNNIPLLILSVLLISCAQTPTESTSNSYSFEFIDKIVLSGAQPIDSTIVGGLSSIEYVNANSYVAISDDRAEYSPARIYELNLEFDTTGFTNYSSFKVIFLENKIGDRFLMNELDPESIRYRASSNTYFYTSEGGRTDKWHAPFIWEIDRGGTYLSEVNIPTIFGFYEEKGLRENGGFESLTFENDSIIWYANELPLEEDGDVPEVLPGKYPLRLQRHDIKNDRLLNQFAYHLSSIKEHPKPSSAFSINSVPELLYLEEGRLWVLERSYITGVGNFVKLFEIQIEGATDVKGVLALENFEYEGVKKRLVLDFSDYDKKIDNIEGMTFGPNFPDGRKSVLFISDNNFNQEQETQLWLFAINLFD